MSEYDRPRGQRLPPIGHPTAEPGPDEQSDFAGEHDDTAVAEEIVTGEDEWDREPESPRGWAGMER